MGKKKNEQKQVYKSLKEEMESIVSLFKEVGEYDQHLASLAMRTKDANNILTRKTISFQYSR
jgi:hypothetical protein